MTIWEQTYTKHKEGGSVQAYPQTDKRLNQKLSVPPDTGTNQTKSSVSGSFEDMFYQTSKPQPVRQQAQNRAPQPAEIAKPVKCRFSPRILSDKLSTRYPGILSKMSAGLSDIWANVLIQTRQDVETLLVCGATRKEGTMPIRLTQNRRILRDSYVFSRLRKRPCRSAIPLWWQSFSTLSKATIGQNRRLNRNTNSLR